MTSAFLETIPSVGAPRLLFATGDPVTADPGGSYSRINCVSLDDEGEVALSADLSGSAAGGALFLYRKDGPLTLLRAGEDAPSGGRYKRFLDLDISSLATESGREVLVLFRAELEDCPFPEGLFLWSSCSVQVIALAKTPSPRGGTFQSFSRPTLIAAQTHSALGFVLAYEAALRAGGRSVVIHPSYTAPLETLAIGDFLGEDEVLDFSLSRMGGCLSCIACLRSKTGEVASQVTFVKHGLTIHGLGLKQGAHFPSLGGVHKLAAPPAVSLQTAFVGVDFPGGMTGLVSCDVVGNAQVFAKSGDPRIGFPNEPVASFGPPVSNAGFPLPGALGVVAAVRSPSGRHGLWSAVFSGVLPLEGEQRLLPLEDAEVVPVKLTNRGALLLQSQVQAGSGKGERWMLIENLFG